MLLIDFDEVFVAVIIGTEAEEVPKRERTGIRRV
jgi:hypothetical protein